MTSKSSTMCRALPNCRLTVLDHCGHVPPIEQPDAFAKLVLDFLGGAA